jgi:TRAP-type transport system periplasmic protein
MKSAIVSLVLLCSAAASASSTTASAAEPVTLKLAFPAPLSDPNYAGGVGPWIEEVQQASGGELKIQVFGPPMANFGNVYDRLLNNVAQVAFGTFGPLASQYPRTQVATLPFITEDTALLSKALWQLYVSGPLNREFEHVKLLALFSFAGSALSTNEQITSLANVKGMKVAVAGRALADVITALGATPVTLTPTEFYQGIQRGTVRGAGISMGAVELFKIDEVTTHHLLVPLGSGPGFVMMNKAAYAALPAKLQKIIDQHSGRSLSEKMGAANASFQQQAIDHMKAKSGQHVNELSAAELAIWEARIEPVVQSWVKGTPDGAAVLAAVRTELKRLHTAN